MENSISARIVHHSRRPALQALAFLAAIPFAGLAHASNGCHTQLIYKTAKPDWPATYLAVCISDHGNVTKFESPQFRQHMAQSASKNGPEGYLVVTPSSVVSFYDTGRFESGLGNPTIAQ